MADKLKKIVVNCANGKVEEHELTAAEIAERDQMAAKFAEDEMKRKAEAEKLAALKASAKTKLVSGEKLTDEEAAAIVI